jgi:hypothetical protein
MEFKPDSGFTALVIEWLTTGKQYIGFVLISLLGGTVSYIGRVKRGIVQRFSIAELLGEWLISGFVALLTAHLCVEMGLSFNYTVFLCGITGHMGGRAIFIFEAYVLHKFKLKK